MINTAIGKANNPRAVTLYIKYIKINAPTNIIPNAIVNSNILLTGACPAAIHL